MKKGRHRRFEEARALKESRLFAEPSIDGEPCAECGAAASAEHASWCLAGEDDEVEDEFADSDER